MSLSVCVEEKETKADCYELNSHWYYKSANQRIRGPISIDHMRHSRFLSFLLPNAHTITHVNPFDEKYPYSPIQQAKHAEHKQFNCATFSFLGSFPLLLLDYFQHMYINEAQPLI